MQLGYDQGGDSTVPRPGESSMFALRMLFAGVVVSVFAVPAAVPAEEKSEYADLSNLIQKTLLAQLPKEIEDRSGWGKTIPIQPDMKLTVLHTRIKVGDKEELPHGAWVRNKMWFDDPAKDMQIAVREVRKTDARTTRVRLEAVVSAHLERERKLWNKGLGLPGLVTQADAKVQVDLDCDVVISLNAKAFPPEVVVEPKVTGCKIEIKEFELRKFGGKTLDGERAHEISKEATVVLNELIRLNEDRIKDLANVVIARALKDGKGKFSAGGLLEAKPQLKPKE
jgi:hypothetical protein